MKEFVTDEIAQARSSLRKAKFDLEAKRNLMDKSIVDGDEAEMKKTKALVSHAQASYERRLSALATLVGIEGGRSASTDLPQSSSSFLAVSWLMILALFVAAVAIASYTPRTSTAPVVRFLSRFFFCLLVDPCLSSG